MVGCPSKNITFHRWRSALTGEDAQIGNPDPELHAAPYSMEMRRIVVVVIDRDHDPSDIGNGRHERAMPENRPRAQGAF
jgi:hypothetical protein